jgi:hypothetical protein
MTTMPAMMTEREQGRERLIVTAEQKERERERYTVIDECAFYLLLQTMNEIERARAWI